MRKLIYMMMAVSFVLIFSGNLSAHEHEVSKGCPCDCGCAESGECDCADCPCTCGCAESGECNCKCDCKESACKCSSKCGKHSDRDHQCPHRKLIQQQKKGCGCNKG